MCVNDGDQMAGDFESKGSPDRNLVNSLLLDAVPDKQLDSICENTTLAESKSSHSADFVPIIRSGEWSDQGSRQYMEDAHVCIADLAQRFGFHQSGDVVAFFGVFDGHGGKEAASFVRDNLPRIIVEDADFPLELEKIVLRSFMQTDERTCSLQSSLNSGTTVLTAMIFGRSLLVANAGDCRAVLSRVGVAIEMSNDHKPDCLEERKRVISLGGFIDNEGYLNGELGVTRALGDWHIEGMKSLEGGGPLSAEPELKLVTLTKEDEFLIIGSDGLWEVFTNQIAVDFVRRRLQEHNDTKRCCQELGVEAIKRGARDNVTVVLIAFHKDPLAPFVVKRSRPRRSISAEGLQSLRCSLSLKG